MAAGVRSVSSGSVRAASVLGRRLGRALRLPLGVGLDRLGALRGVRVLLAVVALSDGLVVGDVSRGAADLKRVFFPPNDCARVGKKGEFLFSPLFFLLLSFSGNLKKKTHQRLLELRVGVLVRLDVLALALLVVVVLVLLRAHLAPREVVDEVDSRVVRRQRP